MRCKFVFLLTLGAAQQQQGRDQQEPHVVGRWCVENPRPLFYTGGPLPCSRHSRKFAFASVSKLNIPAPAQVCRPLMLLAQRRGFTGKSLQGFNPLFVTHSQRKDSKSSLVFQVSFSCKLTIKYDGLTTNIDIPSHY